jgi:hypothetical protein
MIKRLLSVDVSYHFQQYISYISEVSLISVGNKSTNILQVIVKLYHGKLYNAIQ